MHKEEIFIEFINSLKHDRELFLSGTLHNEIEFMDNILELQKYIPSIKDSNIKEKVNEFISSVINSKNYLITLKTIEEEKIRIEQQKIAKQRRLEAGKKSRDLKQQLINKKNITQQKVSNITSSIIEAIDKKNLEKALDLYNSNFTDIINYNIDFYLNNNSKMEIINFILTRKIKKLIHFTNILNLESILSLGILTRNLLEEKHINDYEFTDNDRHDGRPDCTCLSIEYPNTRMLYYKKFNSSDVYVVIVLDASSILLNDLKKYYVYINAANSNAAYQLKNDKLTEVEYLKRMFQLQVPDKNEIYKREDTTPDFITTHPQAEILINGTIDTKDILEVHFANSSDFDLFKNNCKNKQLLNEYKFIVSDFYFKEDRELVQWEER